MSIEEKLKNHFGSKRDLKWDKIHMTINKVFFLFVLLLSSIITAQSSEEIDDSDLPSYSKYVLDSDVNQINNFINSKGAWATSIINNGGRNFTVTYSILNTGQSFTTTYDYSQKWKPSMDEYQIDMNYLRARKIEKAEKERKKKLEIARRAAEFKKNHPLSNLDPYEIKDKIEQIVPFIENFLKLEVEKRGIEDVTKFDVDCVVREDDKKINNAYLRIRFRYETPFDNDYPDYPQKTTEITGVYPSKFDAFFSNLSLFFKSGKGMSNWDTVGDFIVKQLLENYVKNQGGFNYVLGEISREKKEDQVGKENYIKEKGKDQRRNILWKKLDNIESVFYDILSYHPIMPGFLISTYHSVEDQPDFKKTLESVFDYMLTRRLAYEYNGGPLFKGKTGGRFKSLEITQTGKTELNKQIKGNKFGPRVYGTIRKNLYNYDDRQEGGSVEFGISTFHDIEFNVKIIDGKGKRLNSFDIFISIDVDSNAEIIDMRSEFVRAYKSTKIITAQNKEGITQERNNPSFYFDLGVDNDQKGNISLAKDYYLKTIELDPTFEPVYLNLVSLILQGETDIVKEMNGLGSSMDDNKRYDQLTKMRENLYLECVNLLEKYISINGNNGGANQTLLNIYSFFCFFEGVKRMKKKILS